MHKLLVACLLTSPALGQTTWYVDDDGTAPGSGTLNDPYTSIAYALDQPTTVDGDTVQVWAGDYPDELIDFTGRQLLVTGIEGPELTVIHARQGGGQTWPVARFVSGETPSAVLSGFTIRGGSGMPGSAGNPPGGGGIYCNGASPSFGNLIVEDNTSPGFGGGMFFTHSNSSISSCEVRNNGSITKDVAGAGIAARFSNLTILSSSVTGNSCDSVGGGIYAEGSTLGMNMVTVQNNQTAAGMGGGIFLTDVVATALTCSILDNLAGDGAGGGIFATAETELALAGCIANGNSNNRHAGGFLRQMGGTLSVTDSTFESNAGQFGGAISTDATTVIAGSTFVNNSAKGLGMFACYGGALDLSGSAQVTRSVFRGNDADDAFSFGGSAIYGPAVVEQCTIVDGLDPIGTGAVTNGATVENSILWDNTAPGAGGINSLGNATASYSIVEGGAPGVGNLDLAPRFWAANSDLNLLPDSPAIDAGNPASAADADGTVADLGAFPFDASYCGPGCDGTLGFTTCIAVPNSSGDQGRLSAIGSADLSDNLVIFGMTSLPASQFGFLFMGETQTFSTGLGGGQGNLCIGSPQVRFSDQVQLSSPAGTAAAQIDLADLPSGSVFQPGSTWYFQYWFRDRNPSATSNTTRGLGITWS